jgi:hypothetical protein
MCILKFSFGVRVQSNDDVLRQCAALVRARFGKITGDVDLCVWSKAQPS